LKIFYHFGAFSTRTVLLLHAKTIECDDELIAGHPREEMSNNRDKHHAEKPASVNAERHGYDTSFHRAFPFLQKFSKKHSLLL
jgi:hypothetical protein